MAQSVIIKVEDGVWNFILEFLCSFPDTNHHNAYHFSLLSTWHIELGITLVPNIESQLKEVNMFCLLGWNYARLGMSNSS